MVLPDSFSGFHTYRLTAENQPIPGTNLTQVTFTVGIDGVLLDLGSAIQGVPTSVPVAANIGFGLPDFNVFEGFGTQATAFDLDYLDYGIGGTLLPSDQASDPSISGAASPGRAKPGDALTYTFTVTNHGPYAARNVVVTDPLPANTTYDPTAGGSLTTTAGTASVSGGTAVVCIDLGATWPREPRRRSPWSSPSRAAATSSTRRR